MPSSQSPTPGPGWPMSSSEHRSPWGVGLYQVTEIVERHGGRVSVTSKIGAGTTFLVALPAMSAEVP